MFDASYIEKATQEIDAAIFSGDTFINPVERKKLRDMLARWERALVELDEIDEEDPWCEDCDTRIGRDGCACDQEES